MCLWQKNVLNLSLGKNLSKSLKTSVRCCRPYCRIVDLIVELSTLLSNCRPYCRIVDLIVDLFISTSSTSSVELSIFDPLILKVTIIPYSLAFSILFSNPYKYKKVCFTFARKSGHKKAELPHPVKACVFETLIFCVKSH